MSNVPRLYTDSECKGQRAVVAPWGHCDAEYIRWLGPRATAVWRLSREPYEGPLFDTWTGPCVPYETSQVVKLVVGEVEPAEFAELTDVLE